MAPGRVARRVVRARHSLPPRSRPDVRPIAMIIAQRADGRGGGQPPPSRGRPPAIGEGAVRVVRGCGTRRDLQDSVRDGNRHRIDGRDFRRLAIEIGSDARKSAPSSGRVWNGRGSWWARLGSNQRPPACKAGALPLSYAPRLSSGAEQEACGTCLDDRREWAWPSGVALQPSRMPPRVCQRPAGLVLSQFLRECPHIASTRIPTARTARSTGRMDPCPRPTTTASPPPVSSRTSPSVDDHWA